MIELEHASVIYGCRPWFSPPRWLCLVEARIPITQLRLNDPPGRIVVYSDRTAFLEITFRIGGNPPETLILVDEYIGDLASSQKRSSRLDVSIINRWQDSME